MKTTYLLIGGGLASARAVESIRQADRRGRICIVGREPELPYDRPPLSKELLRAELRDRDIRCKPRSFYVKKRVRLLLGRSVERLDLETSPRIAHLSNGTEISFDKCLIATGAEPRRLPVPGNELDGVHLLRTLADLRSLAADARKALSSGGPKPAAVVVGAGFIGMEAAASLTTLGFAVTVIEKQEQIWPGFADGQTAARVARFQESHGISIHFAETVAEFRSGLDASRVSAVVTGSGRELACDLVCVAVGVTPNTKLAQDAGLEVADGIVVNDRLEARLAGVGIAEGVYAAGDVARYPDPYFSRSRRVEHYGQAEYTGLLAGMNMAGSKRPYDLLTYVWSDLFDMHVEFAGCPGIADRRIARGSADEGKFLMIYLSKGHVAAFLAINWPESDFGPLRYLIQQGTDLSGREQQLADAATPLATLLA